MFTTRQDIVEWFDANINLLDYVIIDAPWNYINSKYSRFWNNISYMDIFQCCKTDYMLIWTTTEGLATLMWHQTESEYELKALIPWLKTSTYVDSTTPARVCKEYIAVFCKPGVSFLRTCSATLAVEESVEQDTKPRVWEESFIQMLLDRGLKGKYISPQGFISFDIKPKPKISKTNLF